MTLKIVHQNDPTEKVFTLEVNDTGEFMVPDSAALFQGDFERQGSDLYIRLEGHDTLHLPDYFLSPTVPEIQDANGARLRGETVELLAGPIAPGVYAQVGDGFGRNASAAIGQVETVLGDSSVQRTDGTVEVLEVETKIFQKDVIQTSDDGQVSVTFVDGTIFTLAASSRMLIDELIFDPDGSENSGSFSLIQGGFVFIAGQVAKTGGMEVGTPSSTMGIRGTTVVVEVGAADGEVTSEITLTRDPDGDIGEVEVFDLDGNLIATITDANSKWVFQLDGQSYEVFRSLQEDADDSLLIAEAYAAYRSAFDRVEAGDTFVTLGDTGGRSIGGSGAESGGTNLEVDSIDEPQGVDEIQDIQIEEGDDLQYDEGFNRLIEIEELPVVIVTGFEDASEDTPITGNVNVEGGNFQQLSFVVSSEPNNGTVSVNNDGSFVFVPNPNFNGQDTFTVIGTDQIGASVDGVVIVNVLPINDPPVIADQSISVPEDQAIVGVIAASDIENDELSFSIASPPANGEVALQRNGAYSYRADSNFTGTDSFDVIVTDPSGDSAQATITVFIEAENDAPIAVEDAGEAAQGQPLLVDVLANDTDIDGADDASNFTLKTVSIAGVTGLAGTTTGGSVRIENNKLVFDPGSDFDELDTGDISTVTVSYTMADDQGLTDSAAVTITVTGTNDLPVASADTSGGIEGAVQTIDVLANDTDIDGADDASNFTLKTVSIAGVTGLAGTTTGGSVRIENNKLVFDPGSDFDELDTGDISTVTVSYTMADDQGLTDSAAVTITVTGANDGPLAVVDSGSGAENQVLTIDVLANDTDIDGADDASNFTLKTVSIAGVTGLAGTTTGGSVRIENNKLVFDPGSDFDELDTGDISTVTVSYTMADDQGLTDSAAVTITVTGANDGPLAVVDSGSGAENQVLTIDVLANDTDIDGADDASNFTLKTVSIAGVTGLAGTTTGGSVRIENNKLVFDPGSDFDELDTGDISTVTVSYTMADDQGLTDSAAVTITVTGANDGPLAVVDSGSGAENQVLTIDVLANDTDIDGADDASNFTLKTVSIAGVTGLAGTTTGGSVRIENNKLVFDPGSDFDELDTGDISTVTVSYTMADDQGLTDSAAVTITVTGTNDLPVASADTSGGIEGAVQTIDVLANDTDIDGADDASNFTLKTVSIAGVTGLAGTTTGGSVRIENNKLVFDPGSDFDELDTGDISTVTVSYTMADDQGLTDSAAVTITVTGANDGPLAVVDSGSGAENQVLTIDVLANDTDIDGADDASNFTLKTVSIAGVTGLAGTTTGGSVRIENNKLVFDPGSDFDELDTGDISTVTVSYTMADDQGLTDSAAVTITVTGTNDLPVASADTSGGIEGAVQTIDVLANDTDIDGADDASNFTLKTVSIAGVTGLAGTTTGGSVRIENNKLVFDPGSDFDELDTGDISTVTVSYTMADDQGLTDSAAVTITVTGANDGPLAVVDSGSGAENQVLTIDVLANDTDIDGADDASNFTLKTVSIAGVTGLAGTTTGGSVRIENNKLVFDPGSDFDELDTGDISTVTVSYTMADDQGLTDSAAVTITVTGANDGPLAVVDSGSGAENQVLTIDVLANDTDIDGADDASNFTLKTVSIAGVTGLAGTTTGGSVRIENNKLVFDPGSDFDELDTGDISTVTVSYTMADDQGLTDSAAVTITVTGANDGPLAVVDSGSGAENQVLTIDVLANDTDIDGADDASNFTLKTVSIAGVTGLAGTTTGGSVRIENNKLVFDPGSDFDELDTGDISTVTVSYTMADDQGLTDSAAVTITVTGTNDLPVASADTSGGIEGAVQTIDVLANDTDIDGADDASNFTLKTVSIAGVTGLAGTTTGGSVRIENNKLVFDPGSDFDELDTGDISTVTVSYTMADDQGLTDSAAVTITVTGANDGPLAVVDSGSGAENQVLTIDVLANDTDIDGADDASNFTLKTVSIAGVTGLAGTTTGGSVRIENNKLVFDPGSDFDELDTGDISTVTVSYTMADDQGLTDSATVTITVTGANDGPNIAVETSAGFVEAADATRQFLTDSGSIFFSDPDADDIIDVTFAADGDPVWSAGQLSPAIRTALLSGFSLSAIGQAVPGETTWDYSTSDLDLDFLGEGETISWSYSVSATDEAGSEATQTLSFSITGENDAPVPEDKNVDVQKDGSFSGVLSASDQDANDVLAFAVVGSGPANGTLSLVGTESFTYTPDAGYLGLDSFEYSVTDLSGEVRTANVVIAVQSGDGSGDGQTVSLNILPSGTISAETSEVTTGGVNLIIVLDGSGSISSADFQLQLNSTAAALENLAGDFQAAANVVSVSLVLYAENIGGLDTNAVEIGTFDLINSDFPGAGEEAINPDLINALTNITYPDAANQSDFAAALTVAEDILDNRNALDDVNLAEETNVIYFLTNGVQTGGNQWTNDVDRITNKAYEVDIQAFGLGGSVNLGTLKQLDPDAVILNGPQDLETAFSATPLFGANLVDLSVSLIVDGTDLGEIADETSPAILENGLATELSLAELEGFADLLGDENRVSALAGFDLDGDASTVEIQLFASKVFAKSAEVAIISGSAGSDLLLGSDAQDSISGGAGGDVILGYAGNDTLSGGPGTDVIRAGSGDDVIIQSSASEIGDFVDGGEGRDTLKIDVLGEISNLIAERAINGIEVIDMENGVEDTLTLSFDEIVDLSETSDTALETLLDDALRSARTITGDEHDTLVLDGQGIYTVTKGASTVVDGSGTELAIYSFSIGGASALATLGVDSDVEVNINNTVVA
ncbi:hypothetical protein SuNHUV7_05250 (plasmid) [Pseudoseohaeicola sp. NH-UV-7]|uniref:Ig-like domain-containing protein n=1 Tax=Sulfitobacter sp. TBRI5 TaxID=2989732 RepID=UPI003A6D0F91